MFLFKLTFSPFSPTFKIYLHYNMFLFKQLPSIITFNFKTIYITICFYLNDSTCNDCEIFSRIYITICFYLNMKKENGLKKFLHLHYNMFLFKQKHHLLYLTGFIFTLQYVSI